MLPDLTVSQEPVDPEPQPPAGPIEPGVVEGPGSAVVDDALAAVDVADVAPVSLYRDAVPPELEPGRFFEVMINRILDNSPINFHTEPRARRRAPVT